MSEVEDALEILSSYGRYFKAAGILIGGLIMARLIKRVVRSEMLRAQELVRRFASAVVLGLAIAWSLAELGLNLGYVLGAAGVLTIAIGFAAQTSVSNLISGLFLMSERPFVVGDLIQIADRTGEVLAIDLLSVKLRTVDNLLVRVPNESMLKSNVVNLSHFPIRRFDLQLSIAYHENIDRVTKVLKDVADSIPIALVEPKPQVVFQKFGESSQDIQFSVWTAQKNFLQLKQKLPIAVKAAFDAAGIEIPFPQRVVRSVAG